MLKKQIIIFFFLNLIFAVLGAGLKQKNPHELFLSDQSVEKLKIYESHFGKDQLVFVGSDDTNSIKSLEEKVLKEDGEFQSLSPLIPGHAIIKLNNRDDNERFQFFSSIESENKNLNFAGMSYTNAHLAGMSSKIQYILFPIIFSVMFLVILFFFRNFKITVYLFFASFLGVTVGMATIKSIYSYSTILTTLTPLVAFILTLANQLYVIFGLKIYPNKEEFFAHKLEPILIMMGTTLIGFSSLIWSDLISIRQFGVVTVITLSITWALNLILLKRLDVNFEINQMLFRKYFKRPSFRPILGLSIAVLLSSAGLYSLYKMPLLVEAILFFPKNHSISTGQKYITQKVGGTPQVDLVFSKKNGEELGFEDFKKIWPIEEKIKNINLKILSTNDLVKNINQHYSGQNQIPENKNAYFLLRSKIPQILSETLVVSDAYRISIISPPQSPDERKNMLSKLNEIIDQTPNDFNIDFSGLNFLLLESQNYLILTLLKSLLGSFILITLVFSFFSRNFKEIFIFALINLSSIFGGLLIMNLLGFSLNVSSVMTLSISIGLVVDSTIHLLYAERHKESEDKILNTCIIPMVLSQIVLFVSFTLLGFEAFVPIRQFALGLVAMISIGLFFDLYILPMILKQPSE